MISLAVLPFMMKILRKRRVIKRSEYGFIMKQDWQLLESFSWKIRADLSMAHFQRTRTMCKIYIGRPLSKSAPCNMGMTCALVRHHHRPCPVASGLVSAMHTSSTLRWKRTEYFGERRHSSLSMHHPLLHPPDCYTFDSQIFPVSGQQKDRLVQPALFTITH